MLSMLQFPFPTRSGCIPTPGLFPIPGLSTFPNNPKNPLLPGLFPFPNLKRTIGDNCDNIKSRNMIKIAAPTDYTFQNFKCGEIFCISPAVYKVTCCLCSVKVHLDQFSCHFQTQHLALAEESVNLEVLQCKRAEKLPNVNIESISINDEDPVDDPIKHEDLSFRFDKSSKGLEELFKKTQDTKKHKLENVQIISSMEPKDNNLNGSEKSGVETLIEKPKNRNSRKSNVKIYNVKKLKDADESAVDDNLNSKNPKESKAENEFNSNKKDSDLKNVGNCAVEEEEGWFEENQAAETNSESDIDDIIDELPYPCHTCKRSYRTKHGLDKHNQIVHNPKKKTPKKSMDPKTEHKCDQCNEVFRIARDLLGHKWKHTGIFCDVCGKRFTRAGNMMRHKKRHTGIKDHKCKECGKEFFTDKELKSHLICHTGLMPVICEICGKQCRHRGVLTAHMRRHTGERPAKCDVCGKCFFSIHDLNVHAVAHTSERPFKCDICGSTFQRKKALRVHKLIHSKDRKHVCKICGKGFAQSGGLKSHMRTHNAALEDSTIELSQRPLTPNMLENTTPQAKDQSGGVITSACKTINTGVVLSSENSMLEQYKS